MKRMSIQVSFRTQMFFIGVRNLAKNRSMLGKIVSVRVCEVILYQISRLRFAPLEMTFHVEFFKS